MPTPPPPTAEELERARALLTHFPELTSILYEMVEAAADAIRDGTSGEVLATVVSTFVMPESRVLSRMWRFALINAVVTVAIARCHDATK